MNDKLQQPKRWLVPYPEKKAVSGHPCQDACNGNQKMGQLLHYFLCEASWELERQELDESCKVVKFTRSHEHILKRVHISEKSLIQFLKQLNAWNFVLSEQYGKEFTIQAEPIQKAMNTPVFTKKVRRKSCTSTSENTTTSSEPGEVIESCKVYFLHEKVEALEEVQLYNIALEARIQALSEALEEESCKVVKLQEKVEAGKLYNFTLGTWIDAVSQALKIPSPFIDSVIDRDRRDSERESTGEQTDTTTSAPSLPFDASPSSSPQSQEPDPFKGMDLRTVGSFIPVSHESLPDQSQPGELNPATPIGLRYQEVSNFVPADARPVRCSTTSELNKSTGLSQCSEDVPPDNLDEATFTTKAQAEVRGLAVPTQNGSPQGAKPQSDTPSHITDSNTPLEGDVHGSADNDMADMALDHAQHLPGVPDCRSDEPEIDEEWCTAETETRLPAIPKTPSPSPAVEPGLSFGPTPAAPAPASHDENRDASPGNVTVETGLGVASSVPIPPVPPEVSPPRTMRATVVSPPPQVLVVSQQFSSVEDWKQAQDAFVEQLRGIWKTTTPDFKRQVGNWNVYRKQYLDRWLKANPDPTNVQFTADGKTLFDEWCSLFKARVDAGKANIEAANWLAERLTPWVDVLNLERPDLLRDFKGWCYTNDRKGYYTRGVKLFDLRREFEGWQSYQQSLLDKAEREKQRPQNKYGTVSGLPRLEIDPEWLAAMGER